MTKSPVQRLIELQEIVRKIKANIKEERKHKAIILSIGQLNSILARDRDKLIENVILK